MSSPRADTGTTHIERDAQHVLQTLRARVAGYLPHWQIVAGDAGDAVLTALARYRGIVRDGLSRVPERLRLAFLETLGNSLLPAQAARVPLVFELLPTSPQDVILPASSQVAARLPPPPASIDAAAEREAVRRASDPPRFYTTRTVALSRAKLAALYSVDPAADAFADHSAQAASGFHAFSRYLAMPHELYLGHDALFALAGAAEVSLSIDLAGGPYADRYLQLEWEYLSQDGWLPLVLIEDSTRRLTQDGRIVLRKDCGPDAKKDRVLSRESYWIRARVAARTAGARVLEIRPQGLLLDRAGAFLPDDLVTIDGETISTVATVALNVVDLSRNLPGLREGVWLRLADQRVALAAQTEEALGPPPQMDVIRARVGFSKTALKPDMAYTDMLRVDTTNVFHPFGVVPKTYSTFYLASADTFTRKGATVDIDVELKQAGVAGAAGVQLAFEYYDGNDWKALSPSHPVQFDDRTDALHKSGKWRFVCPEDWAEVAVHGQKNHWLRVRIDQGDYGAPIQLAVISSGGTSSVSASASTLQAPIVAQIRLNYTYFTNSQLLDHCVAYNNFAYRDHSEDCRWTRRPFVPFAHNAEREPALHLGFDQRLPVGLTSVFIDVPDDSDPVADVSRYRWEYRTAESWSELAVLDETDGFRRRGMLQFVAPADAAASEGLGGSLYRLRARLKPGERTQITPIACMQNNAVWGTQGEQVVQEIIGRSDGTPEQIMVLPAARLPVMSGERLEVREWMGRDAGWQSALEGVPESARRYERDPVTQAPRAVWVSWTARDHLYASSADDRHFVFERSTGQVRFGDGRYGRIPLAGATVVLSFIRGIGADGNVPASTITELRTGLAYVQGVRNPLAAEGGASSEHVGAARERASARLRHRHRALAADDYEWLAREASPAVARARCLRVSGDEGRAQLGQVRVVIVPHGAEAQPMPTLALRRVVRDALIARCPPTVARNLRVLAPQYRAIGVLAHVAVRDVERVAVIERVLRDDLMRWLHPVHGGADGGGWPFGARLCAAHVAALIEQTDGVDHLDRLRLRVDGADAGDVVALPNGVLPYAGALELVLSLARS